MASGSVTSGSREPEWRGTRSTFSDRMVSLAALRTEDRVHGLLLVGTPDEEPWHLAAHLDD